MSRLFYLLAAMLVLDAYAFSAVKSWLSAYTPRTRKIGYFLYWGLSVLAIGLTLLNVLKLNADWPHGLRTYTNASVFILYLSKVPVVLFLLGDDLRRAVTWLVNKVSPVTDRDTSRSRFLSTAALVAGGVPLVTLTYGMVRNAYRYRRFAVDVPVQDLPAGLEGLKIVQISDMHSGSWTRSSPLYDAVEMINREEGDVVVFTGDLVNNRAEEMLPYVDIFKEVRGKYGVYSILGNHDYGDYVDWGTDAAKAANMEQLYAIHASLGWDLLRDEHRKLDINGHRLALIGIENWSAVLRFPKYGHLDVAAAGTEDCDCKVLLSHDPTSWDALVRPDYADIDLTLSGHTHGFQFGIEIPGFKWSPSQFIYEQWAGLYRQGKQSLYVNRGLGFLGYPGRVGILPEVTVLTLRRA
ncbi:3',5'-cyclic adenosine monophosphate phosphodiesterase CpdA [Neolewinella maritima]|uniref:3',5'-cyclic adenosine monophosphate phosphodiesterase CpdA n=1 Tax=Neolewinella maritima TaxID=1383882 RepID=A0ABN8F5E6_9BACT|nr:metallophosphoesterase [Neolewinella maritima]CAH1001789.1 3',5'-cyclic adenosine monophosphate phosphodiesterase CpdA [Neolewinella maritima]